MRHTIYMAQALVQPLSTEGYRAEPQHGRRPQQSAKARQVYLSAMRARCRELRRHMRFSTFRDARRRLFLRSKYVSQWMRPQKSVTIFRRQSFISFSIEHGLVTFADIAGFTYAHARRQLTKFRHEPSAFLGRAFDGVRGAAPLA